jgi:hypothetical protein
LDVQFQPLISTIQKKRREWEIGIRNLFSMLLQIQEDIGHSMALGNAIILAANKSQMSLPGTAESGPNTDGMLVGLSGKDIKGLRDVFISWPGVLPKDDFAAANLELQKFQSGIQSVYTTMEKLGEEYPNDEIQRVRKENEDPSLRGEKVAEQTRSMSPLIRQQQDQQFQQQQGMNQMAMPPGGQGMGDMGMQTNQPQMGDMAGMGGSDISNRLRELARSKQASLNNEGDFPVIDSTGGGM